MAPSTPYALALSLLLGPAVLAAQPRPSGHRPTSPHPAVTRRAPRLTAAFAEGAGDEISSGLSTPRAARTLSPERHDQTPAAEAHAPDEAPRVCLSTPIEVVRVTNPDARWTGSLTDCAGRPTARALAALSLIARPGGHGPIDLGPALESLRAQSPAAGFVLADDIPSAHGRHGARRARVPTAPHQPVQRDPDTHDPWIELGPRARVLHPRLIQMLQRVVERFPGHRVEVVSGYRPASEGRHSESRHAHARALDFRLMDVPREALRDFARTLPDAGVGYYPHSVFVHLDVRDHDEGRAFWVDFSGPGERPRYGHWPPNDQDVQHEVDHLVQSVQRDLDQARALESPTATENPDVTAPDETPDAPPREGAQ